MQEIEVGIRVDTHDGLSFFGAQEVNDQLQQGKKVIALKPLGAIMKKIGEGSEDVSWTVNGFSMMVQIDDA